MRRQDGFTLIEVLVASMIMVVVLIATLTVLDRFVLNTTVTNAQNDAQDAARNGLDTMQRDLRNHAATAEDKELAVDKADPYDLVMQSVASVKPAGSLNERNASRVRYCLDATTPANERIWRQTQTWTTAATPALPSTAACPDPTWSTQRVVAEHVVNRFGGQNRPVWTTNGADLAHVSAISTRIFVDMDPTKPPPEREIRSSVAFRNVNQPPVADFEAVANPNGSLVLNASGSFDPEGERVTYTWLEGSTTIGQGLAFTWEDAGGGTHDVTLVATDGSGISESVTKTVP
jgi:prepilin-type N-terminal cleavage/methylation domain-containing protein